MRYLCARPVIDIKNASAALDVAQKTASSLIADLVSGGVLFELTGQARNRLFVFRDHVALFADG